MAALTDRQKAFVDEYLIDLNATQAAIRAGYSEKGARVRGNELLTNRNVQAAVQAAMDSRSDRTGITADRVLQELGRIAFFDIRKLYRDDGTLIPPHELDDDTAAALSSIEANEIGGDSLVVVKKFKANDKNTALTNAMRHLKLLTDKVEVTGKNGGPIQSIGREMTAAEAAQAYADTINDQG